MGDDTLTRVEAEERSRLVSVRDYQVHLDLTGDDSRFSSTTTVRFAGTEVGAGSFIDLEAAGVSEVVLNGRPVDPGAVDPDRARVRLRGLLANNELRVVADCAYQRTGVGLHRFVDPVDGNVYLHTQFEPFDAHRVFACFDQPDLKAPLSLTVTAPEQWVVVANGPVVERSGGTWRFAPTPPLPTYLAAVVAGPYHAVADRHREIELGLYCRASLAPHLDADELLTLTRQGLDFFEAEFDLPYPFTAYDQLFVPEFNFGAMENPGCVSFSERMLFRSRVTEAAREGRATTLLHEMAHMWFGDLVTMRWWDDLWLNESFATYMATDAVARATRFRTAWVRFASGTKAAAARQDQLPSTHPISADIVDTDAVRLHFDGITYAKGASVLKQLVAWVGRGAFTAGVRAYLSRHRWGNATLADFLAALAETSGRDLGSWSKEWLETAGVNTLRPAIEVEGDRLRSLAILQEAPPDHPALRSHRLAVGCYHLEDAGLVRRRRVELDVVGVRTEVPELAGAGRPDLLLLNDDDLAYAKVRLDPWSLTTLHAHLGRVVDPLARNLCWAAIWDMVRDAELAARRAVALVATHAPGEPDDPTLQRLLDRAQVATDAYVDPAHRSAARADLATTARADLARAEPGSDRQLIWIRHLASVAGEGDDAYLLRGLLAGSAGLDGLDVDTDLRWHLVATLAARGDDDGGRLIEAELEWDPTDIGERRAHAARAARPTAEAKARAWELLMGGGLHLATLRAIVAGFAQWGQDELLAPYVGPYLAGLRRLWEERGRDEALALVGGLYPATVVDDAVVAATGRALRDQTLPPPVRRILREGQDGLRRALRARGADRAGAGS